MLQDRPASRWLPAFGAGAQLRTSATTRPPEPTTLATKAAISATHPAAAHASLGLYEC